MSSKATNHPSFYLFPADDSSPKVKDRNAQLNNTPIVQFGTKDEIKKHLEAHLLSKKVYGEFEKVLDIADLIEKIATFFFELGNCAENFICLKTVIVTRTFPESNAKILKHLVDALKAFGATKK